MLFNFINCSYGIDEKTDFNDIVVFPNPARETVCIRVLPVASGDLQLRLYDIRGRLVAAHDFAGGSIDPACFGVGQLPEGLYLLKAGSDAGVIVKKVIITKLR